MDHRFATAENGTVRARLHRGQAKAFRSDKRIIAVTAGTQGGKTVFGTFWFWNEIQKCGHGDYIIATPTLKILRKKLLPTFLWLFEDKLGLGSYHKTDHIFTFSARGQRVAFGETSEIDTQVFFGHGDDPESLEAATAKAAWGDESGQKKFKLESHEALMRRLSIHQGRLLYTTTLYNLGWYVQQIYRPAERGERDDVELVRFESRMNPAFPEEEWHKARESLPRWKFDLFYRGVPTRPAGLIYDSFDEDRDVCSPFTIPKHWPRYVGLDFGGVNTAALLYAEDPESREDGKPRTGRLFLYREYKAGGQTAKEHATAILEDEPMPALCVGGSKSEGQWRREFRTGGLTVESPRVSDVEVGINRVYGYHQRGQIKVFSTCKGYLDEKASYARKLDDKNEPTEKIEDKSSYHFMDAERYIIGRLAGGDATQKLSAPTGSQRTSPYRV